MLSGLLLRVLAMAKLFSHTVAAGTTRPTSDDHVRYQSAFT